MKARKIASTLVSILGGLVLSCAVNAAPVGVDGVLGTEWAGYTPTHVNYDASAPVSNFGNPTNANNNVAYDIYLRSDSNYLYGLLQANGPTNNMNWTNLYFDMGNAGNGSNFGMEVTNNRAFIPGESGYYDLTNYLTYNTNAATGTIEWALSWVYFTDFPNILPAGTDIANGATLRMSQSFSYSVAGGASYGADRLGKVDGPSPTSVPEPGSVLLLAAALAGMAIVRRKSQAV